MNNEEHTLQSMHRAGDPVELDGSEGEGGGQILRTGLALAMLTGRPLRIERIRGKRPKPGLMRQHLACAHAAAEVSGAQVEGAALGAPSLAFVPGPVRAGDFSFQVASAGSCLLVLQTVLPALLLAEGPSRVALAGGTHNPMAPSFHFLAQAFAPLVARTGAGLALTLERCGFYPAGGGRVLAQVQPAPGGRLQPFDLLESGTLAEGHALCLAPGLPRHVAERELATLGTAMGWSDAQLREGIARHNEGPGNALIATLAHAQATEVFCALGEKALSAEQVAARLVRELRAYLASGAAVGPHLADQLVLLLALAVWRSGPGASAQFSCSSVTAHTRTNCAVIGRFLPVGFALHREGARHRVVVTHAVAA